MKRLLLPALTMWVCLGASAQLLNVRNVSKVEVPSDVHVTQAVLSPDGRYAVVGAAEDNALRRIELSTGAMETVTDNGSMLDLKIGSDGDIIAYRRRVIGKNRLVQTGVEAVSMSTGRKVEVSAPSREQGGFSLNNDGVVNSLRGKKLRTKSLTDAGKTTETVVGIHRGSLIVTVNGKSTAIDPLGRGSYLWPQLSPDGKRIVCYKALRGCFTCNLDGSDVRELGYLHAPVWFGNDIILGMRDIDNGDYITASTVVALSADGSVEQTLTDSSVIALYPTGSPEAGSISFTDNAGQLYLISLE